MPNRAEQTKAGEAAQLITEEMLAAIGRSTAIQPLSALLTESDVRRYVEATGDANPLWVDEAFAKKVGYPGRLLPPAMLPKLVQRPAGVGADEAHRLLDQVRLPPQYTDTRNASTEVEWLDPVFFGDQLAVQHRIVDVFARAGRAGLGIYITRETEFTKNGRVVVRVRQTSVKLPRSGGPAAADDR